MIFYFSGTGNSEWVAKFIARELNDELLFMPDELSGSMRYELMKGERLGFIFPCYAWGVPKFVENFVRRVEVENVTYVYFIVTCGDDTGQTDSIFSAAVAAKGWDCMLGRAVQMPESYVCLPGFDVDPISREQEKYIRANDRLRQVVEDIIDGRGGFDTIPGKMPWLKSRVVRPFFNRFLVTPKYFKCNDKCIGCGKCVEACPFHNVSHDQTKRPVWGNRCVQCMRCYHVCPVHAIDWGAFTKNKGQYLCRAPRL